MSAEREDIAGDGVDGEAEDLFHEVLALPPQERDGFIEIRLGSDPTRRGALLRLLRSHERSGRIDRVMEQICSLASDVGDEHPPESRPPERIGNYRVLNVLGEGGMGVVYLAEQEIPHRRVALKVVRSGFGDRRSALRLEREAQILADLQHPGIARVIEAGVFRMHGVEQPFIAMEYVRGLPLLEFATRAGLDRDSRVRLLVRICEAVEYAHRQDIIHRDLKPGNILVDEDGQPRILDFGVARAVGGDPQRRSAQTETGQVVGTVDYMSPEHFAGDSSSIERRSDVYALGVIAYEILSGRRPHELEGKMLHEAAWVVREEAPRALSAHDPGLRGDLERVVMKALAKERERRYASARDLASDLERFLRKEPVEARSPGALYRLSMLARRYRTVVLAAVAVAAVAMAAGTVGIVSFLAREARLRAVAERQRDEILGLADSKRVEGLRLEGEELLSWPQTDEKLSAIESWIERLRDIARNLPVHRARHEMLSAVSGPSPETVWERGLLADLVRDLEDLVGPETGLERRLEDRLRVGRENRPHWAEAVRSISRDCPVYGGLRLEPQDGLIPLERDARTGLWEFLAPHPAARPSRGPDGKIADPIGQGIVLVLLPGGTFSMGGDPASVLTPSDALPRHTVELDPFFISRHEVSFGQWEAVMGDSPVFYADPLMPATFASWEESVEFCRRMGLTLPSEAQWEYAGLGQHAGPAPREPEEVHAAERADGMVLAPGEHTRTVPIVSARPNGFGLHHMLGNVHEWCADFFRGQFYSDPRSRRRNPLCGAPFERWAVRAYRGGSFTVPESKSPPSVRRFSVSRFRVRDLGLRPARPALPPVPETLALDDLLMETESLLDPQASPGTKLRDIEAWIDRARGLLGRLDALRAEYERLEREAPQRLDPRREQLRALVRDLDDLADPEEGLAVRLELLCEITRHAPEIWEHPMSSIPNPRECPLYLGLPVEPQFGLVPLHRDERTGLWIFVHVYGLAIPPRNAEGRLDTKRLALKRTSVLRFVLLPGGRCTIGPPEGEESDPDAPRRQVRLDPFLVCMYEISDTQWKDIMGHDDLRLDESPRPATHLSGHDCAAFANLTGLSIPTEAQWEYACRAGTETPYWMGREIGGEDACFRPTDGSGSEGPRAVDAFAPSPFGLYNVHGNAGEICAVSSVPGRLDTGWVVRGGSWTSCAEDCRSWSRRDILPGYRGRTDGFRPVRPWLTGQVPWLTSRDPGPEARSR